LNQIENISEQFAPPTPDQHRSALLFYNYLLWTAVKLSYNSIKCLF